MTQAFAAYDATAGGILYGLCTNEQNIAFDDDPSLVVAKEPVNNPAFNYGTVLLSSKRLVFLGGANPNWAVNYYERTGQSPLKYSEAASGFVTQSGTPVASLTSDGSPDFWDHNDLFVVMAFQDSKKLRPSYLRFRMERNIGGRSILQGSDQT